VSIPNPGLPPPTLDGSTSRAVKGGDGFVLVTAGGRERSFPTGRAGELVLLDFMTTTCGPCRKAVPTLARLQREYGRSGLEVVGVVCDPEPADRRRELAAAYQDEHRLPYGLCVEPGAAGALQDRYKVDRYPTLVLLDARGRTLWRGHPSAVRELEQAIRAAGE
jgi:thiol-disulfide isomerase/thioredoxin